MADAMSISPRIGSKVKVLAGDLEGVEGEVRKVYTAGMVSIMVHPLKANKWMRENLVLHPRTHCFHWILAPGEFEVFDRREFTHGL